MVNKDELESWLKRNVKLRGALGTVAALLTAAVGQLFLLATVDWSRLMALLFAIGVLIFFGGVTAYLERLFGPGDGFEPEVSKDAGA